jgi:hypothetical protein
VSAETHTWPKLETKQRWQHTLLVATCCTSLHNSSITGATPINKQNSILATH